MMMITPVEKKAARWCKMMTSFSKRRLMNCQISKKTSLFKTTRKRRRNKNRNWISILIMGLHKKIIRKISRSGTFIQMSPNPLLVILSQLTLKVWDPLWMFSWRSDWKIPCSKILGNLSSRLIDKSTKLTIKNLKINMARLMLTILTILTSGI